MEVFVIWIDVGGSPMVRHEGGASSNNLIKDAPHRATVFVGPTLKSYNRRLDARGIARLCVLERD